MNVAVFLRLKREGNIVCNIFQTTAEQALIGRLLIVFTLTTAPNDISCVDWCLYEHVVVCVYGT